MREICNQINTTYGAGLGTKLVLDYFRKNPSINNPSHSFASDRKKESIDIQVFGCEIYVSGER
jgi:hypothetical protein